MSKPRRQIISGCCFSFGSWFCHTMGAYTIASSGANWDSLGPCKENRCCIQPFLWNMQMVPSLGITYPLAIKLKLPDRWWSAWFSGNLCRGSRSNQILVAHLYLCLILHMLCVCAYASCVSAFIYVKHFVSYAGMVVAQVDTQPIQGLTWDIDVAKLIWDTVKRWISRRVDVSYFLARPRLPSICNKKMTSK